MDDIRQIIASSEPLMWDIISYAPRIICALLVLFLGWLIARLIKRAIIKILYFLRVNEAAERVGIDAFLLHGGVRYTSVTLIAEIIYWFLICAIILIALKLLGMHEAGTMFAKIIYYVPKVIVAMVMLIFGTLIARFMHALMYTYLDNIGIKGAYAISVVGQYAIIFFVVFITLEQLAIDIDLLQDAFRIAIGAFGLAFAIAFGLGAKDVVAKLVEKNIKSKDEG